MKTYFDKKLRRYKIRLERNMKRRAKHSNRPYGSSRCPQCGCKMSWCCFCKMYTSDCCTDRTCLCD